MRIRGFGEFWRQVVRQPLDDYLAAFTVCLNPLRAFKVLVIILSCVGAWWIYVPIHEIAHAYGCIWTGGEVTRLEIDPKYGARLLQRAFPFVAVGSEYAGQLKGFDTKGSDLTYLATDLAPYLLTILLGVPLIRSTATKGVRPLWRCVKLGVALPVAYVPFISLPGDYYEMGSILISRLVAIWSPTFDLARWRSDDVFKLVAELYSSSGSGGFSDVAGIAGSLVVGVVLAFATYAAGSWFATLVVGAGNGGRC